MYLYMYTYLRIWCSQHYDMIWVYMAILKENNVIQSKNILVFPKQDKPILQFHTIKNWDLPQLR